MKLSRKKPVMKINSSQRLKKRLKRRHQAFRRIGFYEIHQRLEEQQASLSEDSQVKSKKP